MTPPQPDVDAAESPPVRGSGRRFVVMGVSGVGKTRIGAMLANALEGEFCEGDGLHTRYNIEKMKSGLPLDDDDRAGWLAAIAAELSRARGRGAALVVSCSALKRRYRDMLRQGDPRVTFVHLTGARAIVESRLARRSGHFMPPSLLDSQYDTLEPPEDDERAWTLDLGAPPEAIVADILARIEQERPPSDA